MLCFPRSVKVNTSFPFELTSKEISAKSWHFSATLGPRCASWASRKFRSVCWKVRFLLHTTWKRMEIYCFCQGWGARTAVGSEPKTRSDCTEHWTLLPGTGVFRRENLPSSTKRNSVPCPMENAIKARNGNWRFCFECLEHFPTVNNFLRALSNAESPIARHLLNICDFFFFSSSRKSKIISPIIWSLCSDRVMSLLAPLKISILSTQQRWSIHLQDPDWSKAKYSSKWQ